MIYTVEEKELEQEMGQAIELSGEKLITPRSGQAPVPPRSKDHEAEYECMTERVHTERMRLHAHHYVYMCMCMCVFVFVCMCR